MKRTFLFAKLHNAKVTSADLNYEGSFSIDQELLAVTGIMEHEMIHVYNITRGTRFSTYVIPAPAGSRMMGANGACAHLVSVGDRVILCVYADFDQKEALTWSPKILLLDEHNNYKAK